MSHENIMAQAVNLEDVHVPLLFPGKLLNSSIKHLFSQEQRQLRQLFDDLIDGQI